MPLFAVHISDGVLVWPMLAAGFVLAALLMAVAAWRVREDEIPRIALLTAAFFVASSIHVKLGPTSVHLLLNGLVGVVLGWRAPLAIGVGVALQALLIPHGGISTIGVNAVTEMIPALLAGGLFALLARLSEKRWVRSLLVGVAALVWGWCLLCGIAILATTRLADVLHLSTRAGLVLRIEEMTPALWVALHPLALCALVGFTLALVFLERRMNTPAGFPRGALVGLLAVLLTTLLTGVVLLLGAEEPARWQTFVMAVFVAHLPLALIEGLIVGCIVAFLWRVKPEMLGTLHPAKVAVAAILALLLGGTQAHAHGLLAEHKIDRVKREVTVKCYYETDDLPTDATVRVRRADGSVLTEGKLDAKGTYTFGYEKAEPLSVHVQEGSHKASVQLNEADLVGESAVATASDGSRWRDLLVGVSAVLALAAFVISWRNSVRLRAVEQRASGGEPLA